jgi:aconitate hydratase
MPDGSAESQNLTGEDQFSIPTVSTEQKTVNVSVTNKADKQHSFEAKIRIDTPNEFSYYRHGGILHYVLRNLAK